MCSTWLAYNGRVVEIINNE
jgi:hypothetical protein